MIKNVWHPEIAFRNVKSAETVPLWGTDQRFGFWFNVKNHNLEYYQSMKVTVYCNFQFNTYPFDEHECDFDFGTPSATAKSGMNFGPIQILNSDSKSTVLNEERAVENDHLPYIFSITAKQAYTHYSYRYFSPFTGIKIKIKRKTLALLLGIFYIPTGCFAMLSMISYFIQPDAVSEFW